MFKNLIFFKELFILKNSNYLIIFIFLGWSLGVPGGGAFDEPSGTLGGPWEWTGTAVFKSSRNFLMI